MKLVTILLLPLGLFLFFLGPTSHAAASGNLILNVPDWNQPSAYSIGPYMEWCSPTAGANIMGYWEDTMGRTGLADGQTFSKSPAYPVTAGTWQQGLWHDGTVEMGWLMDTDGWRTDPNRTYPPSTWGGTDRAKNIAPGLLNYATSSWTNQGTGIVKAAYPDTMVIRQDGMNTNFGTMWNNYKAEIDAGRPVLVSFNGWVNPDGIRFSDSYISGINQPIENYYDFQNGGHSVVGVGYIDPNPDSIDGDEYFVCQDNFSTTGRYVAMRLGTSGDTPWLQCVYVQGNAPSFNWVGDLFNVNNGWGVDSNWTGVSILPPNSPGAHVTFGNPGAKSTVVLSDADRTVGHVHFNSDVSTTIQSNAGHKLVLDYAAKSATVDVYGKSHIIDADIDLNSNADITVASDSDLTIGGANGGIIRNGSNGPKGITKYGTGVLKLAAANTYTGGTTINDGTLALFGGNDRLANIGSITVNGGTLNLCLNTQTISGDVHIRGGEIESGTIDKSASDYDGRAGEVKAVLSGSAGLTKTSTGTLTLSGANTYNGGTTINDGTLVLDYANNPSVLKPSSSLNMGGGKLSLKGNNINTTDQILGNLTVTAGSPTIALDSNGGPGTTLYLQAINAIPTGATLAFIGDEATLVSTTSPTDSTGIYGGRITYNNDWAASDEYSPGLHALRSYNSYTSLTPSSNNPSLNYNLAGPLTISQNNSINTIKLSTSGGGQSLNLGSYSLTLTSGGMLFVGGNDYSVTGGTLKGDSGGELIVHQLGNGILTIGSVIADNGAATGLTKAGSGALVLGNKNTYTGNTMVNDGTLALAAGGQVGTLAGGRLITVNDNGTLRFDVQDAIGSGAGAPSAINIKYGTVTTTGTSSFGVNLPAINMTGGTLTAHVGNIGDTTYGNYLLNGNVTTNAAYTIATISAPGSKISLSQANTTFNIARGEADVDLQVTSILSDGAGSNALTKDGLGIMLLSGKSTYTGGTTVNNGTLALAAGGTVGTLAGGRPITVNGNGTLRFDAQDAIGSGAGTPSILNIAGGTVTTTASIPIGVDLPAINMTGGLLTADADNTGDPVLGHYLLNGNVTTNASSTSAIISAPKISLFQSNTTFNVARGSADVDLRITSAMSDLTGSGAKGLTKNGSGIMELKGKNTYTGGTTVNGGTLILASGGRIGTLAADQGGWFGTQSITVNSAGTLKFAVDDALGSGPNLPSMLYIRGGTVTTDSSSFRVTLPAINMTGGTLTADPANEGNGYGQYIIEGKENIIGGVSVRTNATTTTATISATKISLYLDNTVFYVARGTAAVDLMVTSQLINWSKDKNPGLAKQGAGIMVVSGNSTYSGPTTLMEGTLAGAGSPNSAITASTGTHLAPGGIDPTSLGIGTMYGKSLDVTNMTCDFQLQNLGTWDKIILNGKPAPNGTLNINGTNNVITANLTTTADLRAGTYTLIMFNQLGPGGGIFTLTTPTDFDTMDGYWPSLNTTATSIDLQLSQDNNRWQPQLGSQLKYHDSPNWIQGIVPNAVGSLAAIACFGATDIHLDADATVGTILFEFQSFHVTDWQGVNHTFIMDANAPNAQIISKFGDQIIDPDLQLIDNTNIKVDGTSLTVNGIISGAANLTKTGAGILALGGANTYSGTTTIAYGTLQLNGDNLLPFGAGKGNVSLSSNSAVLELNDHHLGVNGLNGTAGSVRNSGGIVKTLTLGNGNATGSYAGTIDNNIALTKVGAGVQTLNGLNTYTGATTISGGTLITATLANGGSASGIGKSTKDPSKLVLDGGTLQYGGLRANATIDRGFTVTENGGTLRSTGTGTLYGFAWSGNVATTGAGNRTLTVYNESYGGGGTGMNSITGNITDDGINKLSFTKDGNSNSRFWFGNGPAQTYSGDTTILAGLLWLGDVTGGSSTANMLPYGAGKGNVNINSAATLNLYHHNTNINGLNDGPSGGGIVEKGDTSGNRTLTLGNGDANGDFSGSIIGSTSAYRLLSLTKVGAGTQIFRGGNYYTSATTVSNGVLELASTGQIESSSAISTALSATFLVNGGTHTVTDISGTGTTKVIGGAELTADSIIQGVLTIGPGSKVTIASIPGGPLAEPRPLTSIPEPSTWAMLLLAAMGLGAYRRLRR